MLDNLGSLDDSSSDWPTLSVCHDVEDPSMSPLHRRVIALGLIVGGVALTSPLHNGCRSTVDVNPRCQPLWSRPAGCLYHGVYPGGITGEEDDITLADVTSYESAAGRAVAWVFFSNNWYRSRDFPHRARRGGFVTTAPCRSSALMLRHNSNELHPSDGPDKTFSLQRIVQGDFDSQPTCVGSNSSALRYAVARRVRHRNERLLVQLERLAQWSRPPARRCSVGLTGTSSTSRVARARRTSHGCST